MFLTATLPLLGVWILAVISPGPDFLAVLRYSAGRSRASGLRVAAGVVTGIAVWTVAALLGVTTLVGRFHWLYTAVRTVGALFLVGFGIATIRAAHRAAPVEPTTTTPASRDADVAPAGGRDTALREWRLGLLTNLANPKALIFFGALFASLLPRDATLAGKGAVIALMVGIAFAWFTAVAYLAGAPLVIGAYQRARKTLDTITGGLFIGLGGLLIPTD